MEQIDIVKAGFLHRQSTVLKRWKRNWFVLYSNGDLKWFETEDSHYAEETIILKAECIKINSGPQCNGITPPDGKGKGALLTIVGRNGVLLQLCADNLDDMSAWHLSLEDARAITAPAVPPTYYEATTTITQGQQYPAQTFSQGVYPQQVQHTVSYPRQQVAYAYPGQTSYYGSHPPEYVATAAPGTQVVYVDGRRRYRYNGTDVAAGMVAGAALGTMMWGPMLWW